MQRWKKTKDGKFAGSAPSAVRVPSTSHTHPQPVVAAAGRPGTPALRWPTRSEWEAAARGTALPEDLLPVARKTYNAIFICQWEAKSRSAGTEASSDADLAQRHRECEAMARQAIAGATVTPVSQVSNGMVVRSAHPRGYAEQEVRFVIFTPNDPGRYALPHPVGGWAFGRDVDENTPGAELIRSRVLRLANGHTLEFADDRKPVVRFPGLESN